MLFGALPARGGNLDVVVDGVRSDAGSVMIGLYDSAAGFRHAISLSTKAGLVTDHSRVVGAALRASRGTESITFMRLPPGRYALIVFHDENDNGRLDENAWGVPIEGYGFGNNAQGILGAPSFDAASVTLGDTDSRAAISLIYPEALSEETSGRP